MGPEQTLAEWMRPFVLELQYTSNRLSPYAEELGDHGEPFRWLPDRRAVLQAELDAAFMHIYGFHRGDVEHILSTFRTLAATEDRLHGEYRTRRLVVAAYDRMTDAIRAGGGWSRPPVPRQDSVHDTQLAATDRLIHDRGDAGSGLAGTSSSESKRQWRGDVLLREWGEP